MNSNLTEEEQIPILSGLAVAKSSLYYWNQQYSDPNSYWSKIFQSSKSQINHQNVQFLDIDWEVVIKADIKGAIKGFIKSLFTGGGALAGAASGAVSASVESIVKQIIAVN